MLKLGKMTDYAVVVLAEMSRQASDVYLSASDLAQKTNLGDATVAKILKTLKKTDIITATRGASGGYALAKNIETISVYDLVTAMEGPMALTACVDSHQGACCSLEENCTVRGGWNTLNSRLADLFKETSIQDLMAHSTNIHPLQEAI